MRANHAEYHYSITLKVDDTMALACLRSIAQEVEKSTYPQISWGGTGKDDWEAAGGRATYRFTQPRFRESFVIEADRLLEGWFSVIGTDDDDPARPQRPR